MGEVRLCDGEQSGFEDLAIAETCKDPLSAGNGNVGFEREFSKTVPVVEEKSADNQIQGRGTALNTEGKSPEWFASSERPAKPRFP